MGPDRFEAAVLVRLVSSQIDISDTTLLHVFFDQPYTGDPATSNFMVSNGGGLNPAVSVVAADPAGGQIDCTAASDLDVGQLMEVVTVVGVAWPPGFVYTGPNFVTQDP